MMLGARTAAWAKSGGGMPTARDYVQDGLFMHLDAIENTRNGHVESSTSWNDLKGDFVISDLVGYTFEDNYLLCNPSSSEIPMLYPNGAPSNPVSAEFVFSTTVNAIVWQQEMAPTKKFLAVYNGYLELGSNSTKAVPITYGKTYSVSVVYEGNTSSSDIVRCLLNGEDKTVSRSDSWSGGYFSIGWRYGTGTYRLIGKLCGIRFYNRQLSKSEQMKNYAIDQARFGIP